MNTLDINYFFNTVDKVIEAGFCDLWGTFEEVLFKAETFLLKHNITNQSTDHISNS